MSFSQTLLFGKFARTQLRPLYQILHRRVYNARLSAAESAVFSWWERAIRSLTPRVCRPCSHSCDWIVYTDSATSPPHICALCFHGKSETPRLSAELSMEVDPSWVYHFRPTCLIFGLELIALVSFLDDAAEKLVGCSIWFYMDSNNSRSAVTRGDSNTATIAVLASRAWEIIRRFHIKALFSRVPSKLNPSDLPTRGKRLPFISAMNCRFRSLPAQLRLCRSALRTGCQPARIRVSRMDKPYPPKGLRRI